MRPVIRVAAALVLGFCGTAAMAEVVVVVSAKSPVTTLTQNQVVNIFLGKSNRFPNATPALPIDQPEGAAVRDQFYASFAGKSAAQVKAHWSKIIFTGRGRPPMEAPDSSAVSKFLANNPGGIGYLDSSTLDPGVKVVKIAP